MGKALDGKGLIPVHLFLISSQDILVSLHSYVDECPFLCLFVHCSNIWSVLLQPLVYVDSHVPSYPDFSILCN